MKKQLGGFMNSITKFTGDHGPELAVGFGIAGLITSAIMAVKATAPAVRKIDTEIQSINEKLFDDAVRNGNDAYTPITKLHKKDVVKICWRGYAPAIFTGLVSTVCIIGGTKVTLRRNAALVTACKLSEMTIKDLREYKETVIEELGADEYEKIETKIDKKAVDKSEAQMDTNNDNTIYGTGSTLYYDRIGGQRFRSDKESIRAAINRLNEEMLQSMYVSLNDLYSELNIPSTVAGDLLGWNIDHGLIEARFSSQLTPEGTAIVVFSTRLEPRYDFGKLL